MGSALTENIALLSLCGTTFEPMTETDAPLQNATEAQKYTLSIQHELQIAKAFAVLLANTDDPSAVGAICLEEQPNGTGLLVRTATNSGHQEARMKSFGKIARSLQQCTSGQDVDTFLEEIIATCKPRLLARLRSKHAKAYRKAGRPAIIPKLVDGVMLLRDFPTRPAQLATVETQITVLGVMFINLESLSPAATDSEPGTRLLKNILLIVDQILMSTDIQALLETIPKNIPSWSGPASQSLARSLTSLAQYYHAAQYLLRRARRDSVFRFLSVGEVPYGLFCESPNSAEPHSVGSGLLTRSVDGQRPKHPDALPKKLEATLKKSRAEIESCIRMHTGQSKRVHAEIQLLLYYEANNLLLLPPRIICSNKHACLLCNLFIKAHGRFHIRSCHGRLYPRWRIPLLEELQLSEPSTVRVQRAIDELNRQLELKIRQHLDQAQLRISDPQESIVFLPGACTPSVLSAATVPASVIDTDVMSAITLAADCSRGNSASSILTTIPPSQREQFHMLEYGHTIETRVYPDFPIRIHTQRIHLELTYEWALMSTSITSVITSHNEDPPNDGIGLLVQVQWVAKGRWASFLDSSYVYDLDSPWRAKEIPRGVLLSKTGLVLEKRGDIIVIRAFR